MNFLLKTKYSRLYMNLKPSVLGVHGREMCFWRRISVLFFVDFFLSRNSIT